jgi:hypothetical protein
MQRTFSIGKSISIIYRIIKWLEEISHLIAANLISFNFHFNSTVNNEL